MAVWSGGIPINETFSTPLSLSEEISEGPQALSDKMSVNLVPLNLSGTANEEAEEIDQQMVDAQRTYGIGRPKGPYGYYGFSDNDTQALGKEESERDSTMVRGRSVPPTFDSNLFQSGFRRWRNIMADWDTAAMPPFIR
ncbi:uncharacterized protein LOC122257169 isoform X2 [Penaeus japonicus]|nr:uncharacterized protein LOC122257169 isoform X2 [Penaeus japonicus]